MLFVSLFHFLALRKQLNPTLPPLLAPPFMKPKLAIVRNERGQGLIEYLVIVALMGVATIAIVRVMGQTVEAKFANVAHALRGDDKKEKLADIEASFTNKKDLGNFMDGSATSSKGSHRSGGSSRSQDSSSNDGQ
jgi:pilus assembly protein Flp/PilA